MAVKSELGQKWRFYLFCFYPYCVIGWLYEVAMSFLHGFGFDNRGVLFGPYLPIYGFGAVVLAAVLKPLMEKKRTLGRIPLTPLLVFVSIVIITTIIEYVTSWGMEQLFDYRWWDYSEDFMNLNGRVCLRTSLKFGLGGMVFLYVFQPYFHRLFHRFSSLAQSVFMIGFGGVMLLDLTIVLIRYFW